MKRYADVDSYIAAQEKFRDILVQLRQLISTTELVETVKWGMPVYTINGKNVVGIAAFKNYAGIWFYQGALLNDPAKVLKNAQEGKTQAMRHWKLNNKEPLDEETILSYLDEAIQNEKEGKRVVFKKKPVSLSIPDALDMAFQKNNELKLSFFNLTPGKQKEYAEYISTAKEKLQFNRE